VAQLVDQSQSGLQLEGEILLRVVVLRRAVAAHRVVQYECGKRRLGGGRADDFYHLGQYLRHFIFVKKLRQLMLKCRAFNLQKLLVV